MAFGLFPATCGGVEFPSQGFEFVFGQRAAAGRRDQAGLVGQPVVGALVIQVAQAGHVVQGQVGQVVADRVVGKIGGVMAPGNIAVGPQVFEDMSPPPRTGRL